MGYTSSTLPNIFSFQIWVFSIIAFAKISFDFLFILIPYSRHHVLSGKRLNDEKFLVKTFPAKYNFFSQHFTIIKYFKTNLSKKRVFIFIKFYFLKTFHNFEFLTSGFFLILDEPFLSVFETMITKFEEFHSGSVLQFFVLWGHFQRFGQCWHVFTRHYFLFIVLYLSFVLDIFQKEISRDYPIPCSQYKQMEEMWIMKGNKYSHEWVFIMFTVCKSTQLIMLFLIVLILK